MTTKQTDAETLTLVSHHLRPYVQRDACLLRIAA